VSQSEIDSVRMQPQPAMLPEVVVEAPAMTSFINGLVNELISLGYDASATEMDKDDLPAQGNMFFQFTDPTPDAAQILGQVESVARKYCWDGTASLAQVNEASTAIVIAYANSTPADCPGAAQ